MPLLNTIVASSDETSTMRRTRSTRRKPRRRAIIILGVSLAVIVLLLAVAGLAVAALAGNFARSGTLARNVSVAGVPLGGLSATQAEATLAQALEPLTRAQVELAYPGGSAKASREELGVAFDVDAAISAALAVGREPSLVDRVVTHWRLRREGVDLPVPLTVDTTRLKAVVAALAPRVNREPRDAKISVTADNTLRKTPGQSGLALLVADSVQKLSGELQDPHATRLELVVKDQPPNISSADLANLQKVLAAYSTPYHTYQRDRTHNMALAIGKVNGLALKPGQEFSLNGTVGERTIAEGYRSAPIFRDGEVVPDTGGGVCQVASTLYNVALLANLTIVERSHHSRPVWYCKAGRDAAVYWGQKNLRFRNSLNHTIVILGEIRGDRLWAAIVGHADDDYDVELTVTGYSTWGPDTKTIEDPNLPPGKRVVDNPGAAGARATLWMTVSKDGKQLKKTKLHDDYYAAVTRVVRVGKAKPTPPPEQPKPGTEAPGLAPAEGAKPPTAPKPATPKPEPAPPKPNSPAAAPAPARGG